MAEPVTTTTGTGSTANTSPTTEDLSRQVDALKGDISRLTESLGHYGRAKRRDFEGEARRRAEGFRDDAQLRYDEIETYVRQNPATSLGIAAAIGLLIGLMKR